MDIEPALYTPPPLEKPESGVMPFPRTPTPVIVSVPALSIPPPLRVSPATVTTAPDETVKIRKRGVPAALLRATVIRNAPGPLMVTSEDRLGRAFASIIVP